MSIVGAFAARFCLAGLVALASSGCSGGTEAGAPASTSPSAKTPPSPVPSPLTQADLVALIEGIPGYTYAPAPEIEQALAPELGDAEPPAVRFVLLNDQVQGNIIIGPLPELETEQGMVDLLAGAEAGGNKQGTATRTEIAGRPAVKTVREDGGVTWSTAKGIYGVIVGARPEVADDLARQVLERLPD